MRGDSGRPLYMPIAVADKTIRPVRGSNARSPQCNHKEKDGEGKICPGADVESLTWFNMVENLWGVDLHSGQWQACYTRSINENPQNPIRPSNG